MIAIGLICIVFSAARAHGVVVEENAIRQAVRDYVVAELEGKVDDDQRVEIHARWQGDIHLEGEGEVEIALYRLSARPFRGPIMVRLELRLDGQTRDKRLVTVDTRFFREVLVAQQRIGRNDALAAAIIGVVERDITDLADGFFTEEAQLEDLRAKRSIRFDQILTRRHVELIPVVLRGDEINLILESSNMRITARGTAQQDGAIGARIKVRNLDSGKAVLGTVIDESTILVGS